MTGTNRAAKVDRRSRKEKRQENGENLLKQDIKNKFDDNLGFKRFELSKTQKELSNLLDKNTLVFVKGYAGTGKSTAVLYNFIKEYVEDRSKNIVIIRTPVESTDDKIGFLPSDLSTKIEPHFSSAKKVLEGLLNKGKVESDIGKRIHFVVPSYILGATLDNSLILVDEAQQISPKILKLLLERIGVNSKCAVIGDDTQLYASDKKRNALSDAFNRFFINRDGTLYPRYEDVDLYEFGIEDVQRSEIVKTVIRAYADME